MKNKNKQGASTGDVLKREFPSGNSISSESSKKKSKLNNDTPSLITRATTKTAKFQESETTSSEHRASRHPTTLTFWNTVVVFINNGSVVEDQTSRWQIFLENMHLIGTAQRKKTGAVNGQIPLSALKSLQNASKALPYQKAEKEKKPPKSKPIISESEDEDEEEEDNNDNADNHNSEDEKTPSKSTRHSRRSQSPATPPQTLPEQGIKSKTKGSRVLSPREGAWRSTWISIMQPHSTAGWAAGFTNFLDELYRTKNSVAINNGSKSVQALENSKDQARQVVLKFKALWSAAESAALSLNAISSSHTMSSASLCPRPWSIGKDTSPIFEKATNSTYNPCHIEVFEERQATGHWLDDVITRMFAYDGIDDLVRLPQDLYRTKDAIAVNNATKSKASLGANDTDTPACDVALRFKDL
ncbi:hypothetical protein KCU91_g13492, partial [Aureobasidium melanogenum]